MRVRRGASFVHLSRDESEPKSKVFHENKLSSCLLVLLGAAGASVAATNHIKNKNVLSFSFHVITYSGSIQYI